MSKCDKNSKQLIQTNTQTNFQQIDLCGLFMKLSFCFKVKDQVKRNLGKWKENKMLFYFHTLKPTLLLYNQSLSIILGKTWEQAPQSLQAPAPALVWISPTICELCYHTIRCVTISCLSFLIYKMRIMIVFT